MRKWICHSFIYLLLAALAVAGVAYARYTNPAVVRALVQQQLEERFRNVSASVESARLRLLGGIHVRELRLARNDGLDRRDFLYVPAAVIYHDKEHMLEGRLSVRKIELIEPQVRIVRERDGSLNISGILGPAGDNSQRLPSVVIRKGTVVIEDRAANAPLLEIRDAQINVVNDPLPTLQFDGSGTADVLGPVRFRGTVHRASHTLDLELELPAIPIGPDLVARAGLLCPDVARHAGELTGRAAVTAHVRHDPADAKPLRYEVTAKLTDGRISHKALPAPLEKVEFDARCIDGHVSLATLKAASGPTTLVARVTDFDIPANPHEMPEPDELGREMEATVTDLPVTDAVLARLPEGLRWVKDEYAPAGPITVRYHYRKAAPGAPPVREWVLEPKGMTACYENFRYPVHDIRGRARIDTSRLPERTVEMELTGKAGDSPVSLRGTIKGKRHDGEIRIDIAGKDLLLDHRIHAALNFAGGEKTKAVVRQFLPEDGRKGDVVPRPIGWADVLVELRRPAGGIALDKRYVIGFKDCRAMYDQFPYPVEGVSGVLDLRKDRWECRGFRGRHKGAEFFVEAASHRLPGAGDAERLTVRVSGKDVPLDAEFVKSLVPIGGDDRKGLQKAWQTLEIGGKLNFSSEIIDQTNRPQAIAVAVGVTGCTMKPAFFGYPMSDVSATVRYANNRVDVTGFTARHGNTRLSLDSALILLGADGAYTSWHDGIRAENLAADRDLALALPDSMRRTLAGLELRSPLDVNLNLIVSAPAGGAPVKMWWDGGAAVKKASFRAGVPVSDADARFHCRGHFDGRQLRGVKGDVIVDRASVFGQPIESLHARLEVKPESPDVVRFRDLKADFFGGTIAGEARLDLVPVLRYDVYLEALNVQLERFGKHNLSGAAAQQSQLSGPARAAVHLTGEGDDLLNLKGNGQVEVKQGKMGQLPILLDIVKAFGLRLPDRTAFEQAELQFGLEGPRVIVQQLDLHGNAVSLRGQGTCDLDGANLNLDFTASLGRFNQVLPPGLDVISDAIGQTLYKIKMRGSLGKEGALRFEQVPVPGVIEPIRRAMRN